MTISRCLLELKSQLTVLNRNSMIMVIVFYSIRTYKEVNLMEGTIKWYNARKGFGFIEVEDGKDVFLHQSQVPEGTFLNEGDKISFDVEESEKGPQATNVKKVE